MVKGGHDGKLCELNGYLSPLKDARLAQMRPTR